MRDSEDGVVTCAVVAGVFLVWVLAVATIIGFVAWILVNFVIPAVKS